MVIIGTASSKQNVFIDEYNLDPNNTNFETKDILKDDVKFSLCLENKKCETVKFSPNGKYFAIGGEAGLYQIYDRNSLKLIHERYTKDELDPITLQRRPNLAIEYEKKRKLKDIAEDGNEENESFVTCLTWINEHTVAVGNNKGEFIYISTILKEYKVRNFVLKEWMKIMDKHLICNDDKSIMNADNIIEEIHEFIGCDVVDNVIETNFGDKTSCLTSHPYFEMRSSINNYQSSRPSSISSIPSTPTPYGYDMSTNNQNRKEGICISGSWSAVFQGCVLKG